LPGVDPALADAVAQITAEAGRMALARWRGEVGERQKADGSPVCEVDLDLDCFLRQRLTALLPDAGWLSEETADNPDRLGCRRVWVVDPIDGTRDYVRGRRGWCVSVALIEDGEPVIGVLDAAARDEAWRAVRGEGATLNGRPIGAGAHATLAGARVPADALAKADRGLFVAVEKPNSIALRLAMVAAGDADLVATLRWGNEWDIAAATLIAHEAGAAMTDALGAPLRFNQPRPRAFGVLATAPAIHTAAVARLIGMGHGPCSMRQPRPTPLPGASRRCWTG
jgi:myo-inositol-1(or 4)-monophosphatase